MCSRAVSVILPSSVNATCPPVFRGTYNGSRVDCSRFICTSFVSPVIVIGDFSVGFSIIQQQTISAESLSRPLSSR